MFFETFETADIFDLINNDNNSKMASYNTNTSSNVNVTSAPTSSFEGKLGSHQEMQNIFDEYTSDSLNNSSAAIVPDVHAVPSTPELTRQQIQLQLQLQQQQQQQLQQQQQQQQQLQFPSPLKHPQQQQVKDVVVPKLASVAAKSKANAAALVAAATSPAASPRATRRRRYKYFTPSDEEEEDEAQTPGTDDDDDSTHSSSSSSLHNNNNNNNKRAVAGGINKRKSSKPAIDLSTMDAEEAKAEKNRQSARDCRLRKKKYIQSLEKRLKDAEDREKSLQERVRSLEFRVLTLQAENVALQPSTMGSSFANRSLASNNDNEPMSPTMREALRIVKMDD